MAIVIKSNYRGSNSTSTLSGNIQINEGTGELIITKQVGNDTKVVNKIDVNGNHYYNINGVELSKIDIYGSHYYNTNGVEVNKIDVNGSHYYDTNGVERITTGVDTTTGYMRMLVKDANGKSGIIVGQNPKNGKHIIATSVDGLDVEQLLVS